MNTAGKELEVKFYVPDLGRLEARLQEQGARQVQPRQHELNLRFDDRKGRLEASRQVLRLRRDSRSRLTFKGPGLEQDGVRMRREIEVALEDFDKAQQLLEALGYQVVVTYEKYRSAYSLGEVEVTLDELPYGNFAEIEGPDSPSIRAAAEQLGLDWQARILDSYLKLFERAGKSLGLEFRDLSFKNFAGLQVTPADLGLKTGR